jgi:hypothetical protein
MYNPRIGFELPPNGDLPPLPCYDQNYVLVVSAQGWRLLESWGWGPEMIKRLERLRNVLEGDARDEMDFLVKRAKGW